MHGFLKLPLLLVAIVTTVLAAGPDEAGVKGVISTIPSGAGAPRCRRSRGAGFARRGGLGERTSQRGMGGLPRQSLDAGVQGATCTFQVGICEGRHQFRNGVGIYQADDRRDRKGRQACRLSVLVCFRPSKNRACLESGSTELEREATWRCGLAAPQRVGF